MSHRAQQIVDAIAAELAASTTLGAAVFTHRQLSVSDAEQEVPAVSVRYGADTPTSQYGTDNFSFIDSLLAIEVVAIALEVDEDTVLSRLLDLRRQIHITLMADRSQGLGFVMDTRYAGAAAPDVDATSNQVAGRLVVSWAVLYRMNITDPA
jgi:hypothetical protein